MWCNGVCCYYAEGRAVDDCTYKEAGDTCTKLVTS